MRDSFSVFDKYLDVMPVAIVRAVIPDDDRVKEMSDAEIIKNAKPDSIDWELRLRLARKFQDFERGVKKNLDPEDFFRGICTSGIWNSRMRNKYKSAFIGRPMHNFNQATDNLLTAITSRFYEIVSIPITIKGQVDHKSAKLLIELGKLLLDRKHGQAVQRSMSMSVPVELSRAEVEDEIAALEAELSHGAKRALPTNSSETEATEEGLAVPSP